MSCYPNALAPFAAPIVALLTHAAVQYKEPYGHHAFFTLMTYLVGTPPLLRVVCHQPWLTSVTTTLVSFAIYTFVLATSIVIYRHFFHPLRSVPGPWWGKTTMWFWVPIAYHGQRHRVVQNLHKTYGPIVRMGPNWISLDDESALPLVYGSTTVRGPWYLVTQLAPHSYSLQSEPTRAGHAARRRNWEPAFSVASLNEYQPIVEAKCQELMNLIASKIPSLATDTKQPGQAIVELDQPISWFAFDVMGLLGWGKSFDLLSSQENRHLAALVRLSLHYTGSAGETPYIAMIFTYLMRDPIRAFRLWMKRAVLWRIEQGRQLTQHHPRSDVFGHLLGERIVTSTRPSSGRQVVKPTFTSLLQDAALLTIAGSDTTSNSIALMLVELSQKPRVLAALREELTKICLTVGSSNECNSDEHGLLHREEYTPILHAVIRETLRLWPVVPSGQSRKTTQPTTFLPNGSHVPKSTCLSVPLWCVHRSSSNFVNPDEWIPERWLTPEEYIPHNVKAYGPFGFGATGCVGKKLAWIEMRVVVAAFVMRFDFEMSKEDAQRFKETVQNFFILKVGALRMKLRERMSQ